MLRVVIFGALDYRVAMLSISNISTLFAFLREYILFLQAGNKSLKIFDDLVIQVTSITNI